MERKQPNPAPTRAQLKNRILKQSFLALVTAFIPKGESETGAEKEAGTMTKKKHGHIGKRKGGSGAVAAATSTPASSGYASDENSDA